MFAFRNNCNHVTMHAESAQATTRAILLLLLLRRYLRLFKSSPIPVHLLLLRRERERESVIRVLVRMPFFTRTGCRHIIIFVSACSSLLSAPVHEQCILLCTTISFVSRLPWRGHTHVHYSRSAQWIRFSCVLLPSSPPLFAEARDTI